ncbi:hypothetical protein [Desulfosporosinus sp. Sb-LF]|nr:hypothetical protein [Desulfosporosinus sp. Sb-LF]
MGTILFAIVEVYRFRQTELLDGNPETIFDDDLIERWTHYSLS